MTADSIDPASIPATYFDGRTARPHPVAVTIAAGRVRVSGEGVDCDAPLASVTISDALGSAPRMLAFADGGVCEVLAIDVLDQHLLAAGVAPARVSVWESSWRIVLGSLVMLILAFGAGYRYGVPAIAARVADRLPDSIAEQISAQTLSLLNQTALTPSELPSGRPAALARRLRRLQLPPGSPHPRLNLIVRKSDPFGANAIALPNGVIIVTDGLFALTENEDELVAVLAHEAGHVALRHGERIVLQSSMMGLFVAWYVGDVSSAMAGAPAALMTAKYSRDLERDADDYAAVTLRINGLSPRLLADVLSRLERQRGGPAAFSYLSTHPATAERLARLRK